MDQWQYEFWVDGRGATEHMSCDPAGLEDYVPVPTGQRVKGASGILLPVAGYRHLERQGPDARSGVGARRTRAESRAAQPTLDEATRIVL